MKTRPQIQTRRSRPVKRTQTSCLSCRKLKRKLRLLKQDANALRDAVFAYGTHRRACPCANDIDGATATCTCGFSTFARRVTTEERIEAHVHLALHSLKAARREMDKAEQNVTLALTQKIILDEDWP
jgi:hypothetical protein